MPRRAAFKESDICRAFRGARKAGETVRIEIEPSGKLTIVPIIAAAGGGAEDDLDLSSTFLGSGTPHSKKYLVTNGCARSPAW